MGLTLKVNFCSHLKHGKIRRSFYQTALTKKKSENEQALEKHIEEDEKVSKELNEKKLNRKVLAQKNTGLKEVAKNVVSLNQRPVKKNCGNDSMH